MAFVIAGISHKGGTGRSVTLANLAYHLYNSGSSVLIVDLDLASPTMGSILGVENAEAGVKSRESHEYEPRNVVDVIEDDGQYGDECLIDLRRQSHEITRIAKSDRLFQFLPGGIGVGDWSESQRKLNRGLGSLVASLRGGGWNYILLDIRSGLSDVLEALGGDGQDQIDLALVHFRWTSQHLAGLKQILTDNRLSNRRKDSIKLVRTAKAALDDESEPVRAFIHKQNIELLDEFRGIKLGSSFLHEESEHLAGDIGFDPRLRWREQIITQNSSDKKDPSNATYAQFAQLAKNIQETRYA